MPDLARPVGRVPPSSARNDYTTRNPSLFGLDWFDLEIMALSTSKVSSLRSDFTGGSWWDRSTCT